MCIKNERYKTWESIEERSIFIEERYSELNKAISELQKASICLYLAVDESIADDIKRKVDNVVKLIGKY